MDFPLLQYKDQIRAEAVVRRYMPDFEELGRYDLAFRIIIKSETADELEAGLDLLVTNLRLNLRAVHSTHVGEDVDANGWLSNARRALEEQIPNA